VEDWEAKDEDEQDPDDAITHFVAYNNRRLNKLAKETKEVLTSNAALGTDDKENMPYPQQGPE